jgi:hypothetical protein
MAQYIDKAAASSACNTQRAYGTMEIIQQLPAAKVVDKEQFNRACEQVAKEENGFNQFVLAVFANKLEKILFGGAK